ncbi:MAG: sensor histidine kinase [Kofleriaceae bacterium]
MERAAPPTRIRSELGSLLWVSIAVWSLFGLVCAASVYWGVRTHGHSVIKIFSYELLVWCAWAAWTPLIVWLGHRQPMLPFRWRTTAIHVSAGLGLGLAHHLWWKALAVWMRPFDDMGAPDLSLLGTDLRDRLFLEVTVYFAVLGVTYAVDYQRKLREREVRAAQLEASLSRAQLAALELQLQPHFLFNTLHAIGGLVRQNRGPEAIEMIAGLSDLLRYSLDHAGKHLVTLDQELAIVARYLEIQRTRFPDRLDVAFEISSDARHGMVPALMLQPLVENAVRHGIEPSSDRRTIVVRACRDGDRLVLAVENPCGTASPATEGIGITNTRARLAQLFGDRHTFELRRDGDRVVAALQLPFEAAA